MHRNLKKTVVRWVAAALAVAAAASCGNDGGGEPRSGAKVAPLVAVGGPVILGGDDLTDHGSVSGGVPQNGWLYIQKALESLKSQVTRPNDNTVAVLGATDSTATAANAGAAYHFATPLAGMTPQFFNGAAAINTFFAELGAGARQPAIIVATGRGTNNDLDAAEGAALSGNAVAIADYVNSGGGLLSHGSGPIAYGWLTALLPGVSEADGCDVNTLSLTPEGAAAFPGLTNAHLRTGPCHTNFQGDLGGLGVLARDGALRNIIIGGATVQLPGSISLLPPTATYTIGIDISHTVIATVQNGNAGPAVGATVTFRVNTGPNAVQTGTGVSNSAGEAAFTYNSNGIAGTDTIIASFVDSNGNTQTSATVEAIWQLPPNSPPTADAGGPYSTPEGSSVILVGTGTDPDGDALTFSWDLNNDGVYGDAVGATASFFGVDGPSTHPVGFQVCDSKNACAISATVVAVANVPPTATASGDATVSRGEAVTVTGTWTDPAVAADNLYGFAWDLDGDGAFDVSDVAPYDSVISQTTSFAALGTYTLTFRVTDKDGASGSDTVTITVINLPPDCSAAAPSVSLLWPPNHKMVDVSVTNVTDPDGDPLNITITSIRQDEPTNTVGDGNTPIDGAGVGTGTAQVRAERSGNKHVPGNGRVYHIGYVADDGNGGTCTGVVQVGVPHDQGGQPLPVDDGPLYDSTQP